MWKNRTLDQILNDWNTELEDHVKLFTKQAIDVANADKVILANTDMVFNMRFYDFF
jgi:hypothetical protein